MKKTLFMLVTLFSLLVCTSEEPAFSASQKTQEVCFFSYEQEAGLNKICFYDCISGTVAITIKSFRFCPFTIQH